ncbi:hypothetical protein EDC52_11012 [Biostraticola tofi]|uniref:MFS transporter n=1 Tax=Biostraticola tofi TaxID=466109 RepID=A0A4R3YL45_9GAMM|nr:hypothetical protein EDC52_11012 [Biostraticola tofi]
MSLIQKQLKPFIPEQHKQTKQAQPKPVLSGGRILTLAPLSFAAMCLTVLLPGHSQLILLVVCAVGFDLGVQATLVGHQTIIYALQPDARSRLNALLFTGMFIGMAAGAALGSRLLESGGWMAVVILATVTGAGSLVMRWLGRL